VTGNVPVVTGTLVKTLIPPAPPPPAILWPPPPPAPTTITSIVSKSGPLPKVLITKDPDAVKV
jgi:hypothetical protein